MALHILNRPPADRQCLASCLDALSSHDALLLIEDGVYHCLQGHADNFDALPEGVSLYALGPDVEARGLGKILNSAFSLVDDAGFVQLCCDQDKVVSWF